MFWRSVLVLAALTAGAVRALDGAAVAQASDQKSSLAQPLKPAVVGTVVLFDKLSVPTTEVLLNNGEYRTFTENNGTFAFYNLAEGASASMTATRCLPAQFGDVVAFEAVSVGVSALCRHIQLGDRVRHLCI